MAGYQGSANLSTRYEGGRQRCERLFGRFAAYRLTPAVAVWLVVALIVLLVVRAMVSTSLSHDDAITMLSATCNQGRYSQFIPIGQWVSVQTWQDYWSLRNPGCFDRIRTDLAHFDIHPPLYFWLLHIWFSFFGVSIPAAAMLNVVLVVMTALLLFAVCRVLEIPTFLGAAAVLTWALSMAVRASAVAIRQYALLGLWSTLLLLFVCLWFTRHKFGYLVALAPVIALGLLTQYLFVVPAGFALLLVGVAIVARRRYWEFAGLVAVGVVAVSAFGMGNPGFWESFHRGGEQAQHFSWPMLGVRIVALLGPLYEAFAPIDPAYQSYGVEIGAVVGGVLTVVVVSPILWIAAKWVVRRHGGSHEFVPTASAVPLQMFFSCWLAIIALYVSFISPVHSMRPLYLYFITPFLFVGLAVSARRSHVVAVVLSVLLVFQFVGVTLATVHAGYRYTQTTALVPASDAAIVIDSDRRGVVPPTLWSVPPDAVTFVASQDELINHFPDLSSLSNRHVYYVSRVLPADPYGNSIAKRNEILQKFADRGYASAHLGANQLLGGADVYRLVRW